MGEHLTLEEAVARRAVLRQQNKTLVFTNGHFDLLHVGHLDYLEKAQALGDALFLGLNGDASTTRLKGEGRPLIPALERARLLAALAPVSAVIIFEDDTADALLNALQPDIYISLFVPQLITSTIKDSFSDRVDKISPSENDKLVYLVAYDLSRLAANFVVGKIHPGIDFKGRNFSHSQSACCLSCDALMG